MVFQVNNLVIAWFQYINRLNKNFIAITIKKQKQWYFVFSYLNIFQNDYYDCMPVELII